MAPLTGIILVSAILDNFPISTAKSVDNFIISKSKVVHSNLDDAGVLEQGQTSLSKGRVEAFLDQVLVSGRHVVQRRC